MRLILLTLLTALVVLPISLGFNLTIHPTPCEEGQTICDNNAKEVLTCSGGKYYRTECPFGCELGFGGDAKCRDSIPKETCTNGIDDDGNGLTDGDDPDCKSKKQYNNQNSNYDGAQYFLFTIIIFLLLIIIYIQYKKNKSGE